MNRNVLILSGLLLIGCDTRDASDVDETADASVTRQSAAVTGSGPRRVEQRQTDSNASLTVVEQKVTDTECASGAASDNPTIHQSQSGTMNEQRMEIPMPASGTISGITMSQSGIMNKQEMSIDSAKPPNRSRTRAPDHDAASAADCPVSYIQRQSGSGNYQSMDARKAAAGTSVLQTQSGTGRVQSLVVDGKKAEGKAN